MQLKQLKEKQAMDTSTITAHVEANIKLVRGEIVESVLVACQGSVGIAAILQL